MTSFENRAHLAPARRRGPPMIRSSKRSGKSRGVGIDSQGRTWIGWTWGRERVACEVAKCRVPSTGFRIMPA